MRLRVRMERDSGVASLNRIRGSDFYASISSLSPSSPRNASSRLSRCWRSANHTRRRRSPS